MKASWQSRGRTSSAWTWRPVRLDRSFDLVVSLEVAEHLPAGSAENFVDSLTRLGPVVLFSGAIPYQGGVHHVNEQWPGYWAGYFQARDYVTVDAFRRKLWDNQEVEFCYAQNILLFVKRSHLQSHPGLQRELEQLEGAPLNLVHPRKYLAAVEWNNRFHSMAADLASLLGPGNSGILVDEDNFRPSLLAGSRLLPFSERAGLYWGPPLDSAAAIAELERLRQAGAAFIAFAWPAFWWLEYYAEFGDFLNTRFSRVLQNDRLIVFGLNDR